MYNDGRNYNIIGNKYVDFQGFVPLSDYKEGLKKRLIGIAKIGKWGPFKNYHTISELGITGGRDTKHRIENLGLNKINFKNKTVLDIGCSEGIFCHYAIKHGAKRVVGIDLRDVVLPAATFAEKDGELAPGAKAARACLARHHRQHVRRYFLRGYAERSDRTLRLMHLETPDQIFASISCCTQWPFLRQLQWQRCRRKQQYADPPSEERMSDIGMYSDLQKGRWEAATGFDLIHTGQLGLRVFPGLLLPAIL